MNEFWHSAVTDRSFNFLQELRKKFDFILIGGWAVYFYAKTLKSKDIDIIASPETLGRLKQEFDVFKNERLRKYEIKADGFDVDIYVPFWSELGLPAEYVMGRAVSIEGFRVPEKEILLILKLFARSQRKTSLKGKKDALDVLSLLYSSGISIEAFKRLVKEQKIEFLLKELADILNETIEAPELALNRKTFADFKKKILKYL